MHAPTRPHPVLPTTRQAAPVDRAIAMDERVRETLRRYGPGIMRWTLGIVFIWFGALKVLNVTPVAALVADTLAFVPIPASIILPALGVFEIVAGGLLVAGRMLRAVLAVLTGHLIGTFLVLVTQPHVAFQDGNPFLLTTEGEFVVKNLVLIAGTLLVAAALPPLRRVAR
jgi:putative oxidoreductase